MRLASVNEIENERMKRARKEGRLEQGRDEHGMACLSLSLVVELLYPSWRRQSGEGSLAQAGTEEAEPTTQEERDDEKKRR